MTYKLKLIRGRSYSGYGVKATEKEPFVTVSDKRIVDYLVGCKRFSIAEIIEPDAEPSEPVQPPIPEDEPSEKWTVAQLQAYAEANGIPLDGTRTKPEIFARIQMARSETEADFTGDE